MGLLISEQNASNDETDIIFKRKYFLTIKSQNVIFTDYSF